jgi:predicted acylesterase/phospholipase RssA
MQAARALAEIQPKGRSFATVLSIDGGGVRGIIAARVLAELERRTQRRVSELFDLVAGTGSGGAIALALSTPGDDGAGPRFGVSEIAEILRAEMPRIYWRRLRHRVRTLGGLIGPRYSGEELRSVLRTCFGDYRLDQATTPTLVTAYDVGAAKPFLFRSYPSDASGEQSTWNDLTWEAAYATWAMPTYFPPLRLSLPGQANSAEVERCIVSGDVFASNPAACALADSQRLFPGRKLLVISLGTARGAVESSGAYRGRRGSLGSAGPILQATSAAQRDAVDFQLDCALPSSYFRFQGEDVSVRMDDTSPDAMRCLQQAADELIENSAAQLARVAGLLLANLDSGGTLATSGQELSLSCGGKTRQG